MEQSQFQPPSNLAEAEHRRDELTLAIELIQTQLGGGERIDPDTGRRLNYAEWQEWRTRAKGALTWKRSEVRYLKSWIKDYQRNVKRDFGTVVIAKAFKFVDDDSNENFDALVDAVEDLKAAERGSLNGASL